MSAYLKYKAKVAEQRTKISRMIETPDGDKGADFKTNLDAALADLESMKGHLTVLKGLDADEAADDAEAEPVAAERSIRRAKPIGDAPAAHTEKRNYSFLRALALTTDGKQLDGLEGELHQEIIRRCPGRNLSGLGFFMPTGADPEIRRAMYPNSDRAIRRDLTTSTGAGGIFNVPELPLIDLLRAKLVVRQLGAKFLTGLQGTFSIPRQTGKATVYWFNESGSATASNQTIDQVPFVPKVAIALTSVSRQFMNQTSVDAEDFVKEDLAETMARELDRVAINGAGTTQPLGLLQIPAIQTASAGLALGSSGGVPTYAAMVAMESLVATNNADVGSLSYLTNPKVRGELKTTPLIGTTFPNFVWTPDDKVNGRPAYVTSNVPSNGTKGSGSALSSIIYGNWNDLIVAQWEGVGILVNPYTNQASGAVVISMEMSVDVEVRHNESFAIITDAA